MFAPKDYLYTIAVKRKEYFEDLLQEANFNLLEIEILMFLHLNPHKNTLTEIINARDFTKSHVSTAISHLEKEGYLSKCHLPKNKKTIKLSLLPKSEPIINKAFHCLKEFHNKAFVGISQSEMEEMEYLLKRICNNLKEEN